MKYREKWLRKLPLALCRAIYPTFLYLLCVVLWVKNLRQGFDEFTLFLDWSQLSPEIKIDVLAINTITERACFRQLNFDPPI
jgi:hypothetical protein